MKIYYALLPIIFLLTGCDSSDATSETELCPYYVQKDLDNKNYDKALGRLSVQQCKDAYDFNDESKKSYLLAEATAHLGKAGLPITEIVKSVLPENEDEKIELSGFVANISNKQKSDAKNQIEKARTAFKDYLTANNSELIFSCKNDSTNFTDMQRSTCLSDSFIILVKATQGVQSLLSNNKDLINEWAKTDGKNSDGTSKEVPDEMKFSLAAIQFSLSGTITNDKIKDDYTAIYKNSSITFPQHKTYKLIQVSQKPLLLETRLFLADNDKKIIMTDGICKLDLIKIKTSEKPDGINTFPCPEKIGDKASSSVNDHIVDSLNEGINNIKSLAESVSYNTGKSDSEMKDSMDTFKCQIVGNKDNLDEDVTMPQLLEYMLKTTEERHSMKATCKNL